MPEAFFHEAAGAMEGCFRVIGTCLGMPEAFFRAAAGAMECWFGVTDFIWEFLKRE